MYYYPKLQSIFIANPKTGTYSVLAALSPYQGRRRDIILPGFRPLYVRLEHPEHPTAQQVLSFVGKKIWEGLFTFCVVRNPWDRLLSVYSYGKSNGPRHPQSWTFEQVVRWACDPDDPSFGPWQRVKDSQYRSIVGKDGKCLVDAVLRTEQLTEALQKMAESRWGISLDVGVKNTSAHGTRQERYTSELRDLVAKRYRKDIDLFGYQFETGDEYLPSIRLSRGSLLLPCVGAERP